ncbi:MAG: DUF2474 domain-containing protein [Hyphomicrobiaceae bacterium]
MKRDHETTPLGKRLVWFALLWAGGVLAVTLVGLMIKLALK